ncbi:hypothetical protein [Streptomyces sp. NPDC058657]|uniref:hypothetical protein n=1 Tax=unclassified Streptomyces TaxID=2593676 RepID=UPI00364D18B9
MNTTLAAGPGATVIGSLGTGGIALVLFTALVLGTSKKSKIKMSQTVALTLALCTGTMLIAAGQIWGIPHNFTKGALDAAKIGTGSGPLGDVQPGAIAIVLVLIAYMVTLSPRASAVTGIVMATVFGGAGGAWAMICVSIGDFFKGLA